MIQSSLSQGILKTKSIARLRQETGKFLVDTSLAIGDFKHSGLQVMPGQTE